MGCGNGSKGTKDQQLIGGKTLRDGKRGHKKQPGLIQKGLCYRAALLDKRMSWKIQNSELQGSASSEEHGKLENRIDIILANTGKGRD